MDPVDFQVAAVENWKREYDTCREVLEKYQAGSMSRLSGASNLSQQERWESIRGWLLKWIDGTNGLDAHPLHQFGWLRDSLCKVQAEKIESLDQYVTNILFWLVQDCRNHFLHCTCQDCTEDQGVPLARLCLWVPKHESCKVLVIDSYPPHRRSINLNCWPTVPELVNVGQAIWQTPEQARTLLMEMCLNVASMHTPFSVAPDPVTLNKDLTSDLFVARDQPISLQVFDTPGCLGKRVVGISGASAGMDIPDTAKTPSARRKAGG
jgi:hypothetical protein